MNWRCPKCGMVREATAAPWCRHGDVRLPAARMETVKPHWPLYSERSTDAGYEWLAGR